MVQKKLWESHQMIAQKIKFKQKWLKLRIKSPKNLDQSRLNYKFINNKMYLLNLHEIIFKTELKYLSYKIQTALKLLLNVGSKLIF